ncbi:probable xyloglucan endotransglucosylase/hydrolase protein 30 [Tanacetum coccineum]
MNMNDRILNSLLFISLILVLQPLAGSATTYLPRIVSFENGFTQLFGGDSNLLRSDDDNTVHLHLDQYTGAGFRSSDLYNHGLFSAKIKLPSDYTAGIVVAFYTSNGDVFQKTHDELDFEFLGNIKGKPWRFYIDEVPIREILRSGEMGSDFPSKPMALYATIWDASNWATNGGKYKVNYKYAPFVTEMTDLVLHGCVSDPIQELLTDNCEQMDKQLETIRYNNITRRQRGAMKRFRETYMYYSYCYDTFRYPIPPPECVIDPLLRQRFKETGRPNFGKRHHRHSKKASQVLSSHINEIEDED